MIKSTPYLLENNNTKEVSHTVVKVWTPNLHNSVKVWTPRQASQPGDLTKGLGIHRTLTLKASGI